MLTSSRRSLLKSANKSIAIVSVQKWEEKNDNSSNTREDIYLLKLLLSYTLLNNNKFIIH